MSSGKFTRDTLRALSERLMADFSPSDRANLLEPFKAAHAAWDRYDKEVSALLADGTRTDLYKREQMALLRQQAIEKSQDALETFKARAKAAKNPPPVLRPNPISTDEATLARMDADTFLRGQSKDKMGTAALQLARQALASGNVALADLLTSDWGKTYLGLNADELSNRLYADEAPALAREVHKARLSPVWHKDLAQYHALLDVLPNVEQQLEQAVHFSEKDSA